MISLEVGDNLFLQGDKARMIHITRRGQLEVYYEEDGEEFILGRVLENEILGEMASLERKPRGATVRALEHCEVIGLNIENLHS